MYLEIQIILFFTRVAIQSEPMKQMSNGLKRSQKPYKHTYIHTYIQ